ncbi:MAG: hypothetical protein IMY67_04205 [Bacteroidetes bacterium]|nr:hypothetical protein [Bacteroidota bacterium]
MALGTVTLGTTSADKQIIIAIENTELMPDDAKRAVKDYIKDSFNDLWNTFEELIEIQPPDGLLEYWDIVLQIIQSLMT